MTLKHIASPRVNTKYLKFIENNMAGRFLMQDIFYIYSLVEMDI